MADRREDALDLWAAGTERLRGGDRRSAVRLFTESIALFPTAEAFTFRGWAYSSEGRLDEAIVECRMAIATDPDLGNPYNDLGAYLAVQRKLDEALEWFELAKHADRYQARHYPYLNLGRLYTLRHQYDLAALEFLEALEHSPGDPVAAGFLALHPLRPS